MIRDSRGMSLLGILALNAALAGGVYLILAINQSRNQELRQSRVIASRDHIKNLLDHYVSDPALFAASLNHPANRKLRFCAIGVDPASPPAPGECADPAQCCLPTSGQGDPLVLLDPADLSGVREFGGPPDRPARFDALGSPCAPGSADCVLEVVMRFKASCPDGEAACARASKLGVGYEIRQTPGAHETLGFRLQPWLGELEL